MYFDIIIVRDAQTDNKFFTLLRELEVAWVI